MSKMRHRGLWVVVLLEVLTIAGLIIWGVAIREPATAPTQQDTSKQQSETTYNAPKVELAKIAEGLTQPTALVSMPGPADARLFVAEQAGTIRVVKADKSIDKTPFLDIRSKVQNSEEMGLLGLAFHPKVAENNFFYVNYVDKSRNTVIARYTITASGMADKNSEKVLLKVKQPFANHNGGQLTFGPDGYLYIGLGDGGDAGDPDNRAQNTDDLLGKILRINVDEGDPYSAAAGNPFATGGGKPEIWALGLRNPWRFSFDRKTGDLYIADVGQENLEEINVERVNSKGGKNYGWRCYEGANEYNTSGCKNYSDYTAPVYSYDHSNGRCSVTGGHVYRGGKYPALDGHYFYGDYCNGEIYYLDGSPGAEMKGTLAMVSSLKISTFGEGSTGELFVAGYDDGAIYQITDTAN